VDTVEFQAKYVQSLTWAEIKNEINTAATSIGKLKVQKCLVFVVTSYAEQMKQAIGNYCQKHSKKTLLLKSGNYYLYKNEITMEKGKKLFTIPNNMEVLLLSPEDWKL
jgi:hypothetical protein